MRNKFIVSICVAAVLIAAFVIYAALFGCQTAVVIFVKNSMAECPVLYKVPKKIELEDKVFSNGITVSYFKYEFEVPWLDIEKKDEGDNFVRVLFKSGKGVCVLSPKTGLNIVQRFRGENPKEAQMLSILLGKESLQSNYDFYNTVLRVTPKDISIFRPLNQVVRASVFLSLKRMLSVNGESGLFEFKYRDFRGFQFGSPAISDKVLLDVFDRSDRHLQILAFVIKGKQAKLSQEEVNHIILTLRSSSN